MPVLPQAAIKIFDEMRSPEVTAARLAEFVEKDPVLASAVLKVANSALYRGRTNITDLAFAIARVGLLQIRNLLLALVLRSRMSDPQVYGRSGAALMEHSLAVAFGANLVAEAMGGSTEEAFMCGLLHDFGRLALVKVLREREQVMTPDLPVDLQSIVDRYHPEAGALLARSWSLPEAVIEVARYHHRPQEAPQRHRSMVAVVSLADGMARKLGLGRAAEEGMDLTELPASAVLAVGPKRLQQLESRLPEVFQTARGALFG